MQSMHQYFGEQINVHNFALNAFRPKWLHRFNAKQKPTNVSSGVGPRGIRYIMQSRIAVSSSSLVPECQNKVCLLRCHESQLNQIQRAPIYIYIYIYTTGADQQLYTTSAFRLSTNESLHSTVVTRLRLLVYSPDSYSTFIGVSWGLNLLFLPEFTFYLLLTSTPFLGTIQSRIYVEPFVVIIAFDSHLRVWLVVSFR